MLNLMRVSINIPEGTPEIMREGYVSRREIRTELLMEAPMDFSDKTPGWIAKKKLLRAS